MTRVSVIIPCYNRADVLAATLDSVRIQTSPNWEALIVDDFSTDNSTEIIRQFARHDPRFQGLTRQGTQRGANICRNQGLAAANGEYLVFLDADDLLAPTCLERRIVAMDAAPECDFGVYQTEIFAHEVGDRRLLWNAYTTTSDLDRFLSLDSVWHTMGPIWRKPALQQLGGFDPMLPSFQDWDISVRALIKGARYFKVPIRDGYYRNGRGTDSSISKLSGTAFQHLQSHAIE